MLFLFSNPMFALRILWSIYSNRVGHIKLYDIKNQDHIYWFFLGNFLGIQLIVIFSRCVMCNAVVIQKSQSRGVFQISERNFSVFIVLTKSSLKVTSLLPGEMAQTDHGYFMFASNSHCMSAHLSPPFNSTLQKNVCVFSPGRI